jgi:N-acetylglucosaminyldiphosphoundecaprenol N-acetyl-beta-D-mannosaminyltransferase
MSRHGLEWLYRFGQEPARLGHRYFVRDPRFAFIVGRELLARQRRPGNGPL